MRRARRPVPLLLLTLLLPAAALAQSGSLTAVRRDVVVSQALPGRVVAVLGNVRIAARVSGDVIVWGGNVTFAPGGSVAGDLLVFGGSIDGPAGGALPVEGRVSTPGSLLQIYLAEMRRAPWEGAGAGPAVLGGLHLIALSAWLAVALGLLYFFASPLSRAAMAAEDDWSGSLLAGALGVLTLFLAAGAALSLLPSAIAIPIALFSAAVAVVAKVFGMAALFLLLGQRLVRSVAPARRPAALAAGFVVLGGASLVPFVGALVWSAASIVAVGVALLSRFGTPRYHVAFCEPVDRKRGREGLRFDSAIRASAWRWWRPAEAIESAHGNRQPRRRRRGADGQRDRARRGRLGPAGDARGRRGALRREGARRDREEPRSRGGQGQANGRGQDRRPGDG